MVDNAKSCPKTADWDPYDPEFRRNPFPTYKAFRTQCPIGRSSTHGGFVAVSRYDDVLKVCQDSKQFTSKEGISLIPLPGKALPMEVDPPEHTKLRAILRDQFTIEAVKNREEMVREAAQDLIRQFCDKGEVDLSEQYGKLLPTTIICKLLGITELDPNFQIWTEQIIYDPLSEEEVQKASDAIYDYFKVLVAERRKNPGGDDFISILLRARIDNEPLDRQEVLDFCWFLLIAGLDNTAFSIRNMFLQISQNSELRELLRGDHANIPGAVEEILRLYSPVWGIMRTNQSQTQVGGETLEAGERILMLFASADRDEAKFPDPDRFILNRDNINRHLAFGAGRHSCLGSQLARLEIRVAVEEILKHLPDYKVVEEVNWNAMGPLRVTFSPKDPSSIK